MRRLIERRLVTDRFRDSKLPVHRIKRAQGKEWREPFLCSAASEIFTNYDLSVRHLDKISPKIISDKILHARVVGVIRESSQIPDGLLVASDHQHKSDLFHFTAEETCKIIDEFLKDQVMSTQDGFNKNKDGSVNIGSVFAVRE